MCFHALGSETRASRLPQTHLSHMAQLDGSKVRQGPNIAIRMIPRRISRLLPKVDFFTERLLGSGVETVGACKPWSLARDIRGSGGSATVARARWATCGPDSFSGCLPSERLLTR